MRVTRIRGIAIVGVPIMVMAGGEDACKVIGDYSTVHLTCCSYVADVAGMLWMLWMLQLDIGYVAMCLSIQDV